MEEGDELRLESCQVKVKRKTLQICENVRRLAVVEEAIEGTGLSGSVTSDPESA